MNENKTQNLLAIVTVGLLAIIVILTMALSKSWKNERFLDSELNKYTTNSTNMIK